MVSIIILTKDNLNYTKDCIESILENTSQVKSPFEIIVVDNGSKDGTMAYLKGLETGKQITAIYNQENLGFPKGVNQGAKIAKGDYLCLLNNDAIVTEGWMEKLLRCIRSDTQIAAVGPYSSYSSGYQQSPIQCDYNGKEELKKFAIKYSQPDREVDFLVFFCTLIKKGIWDGIGGLDETFTPGNFEDNLFCWETIKKHYKLKIAGNCFIHHYAHTTWDIQDPKKRKEFSSLLARNQKIFLKKIGQYKTVAVSMIVSDKEKLETLKRCLESIVEWVDEIQIVFNHKGPFYDAKLEIQIRELYPRIQREVVRWHSNFSELRNLSLNMCKSDYIIWLDADDIVDTPLAMRDLIFKNPDMDVFRCRIVSQTEIRTSEIIYHNRLFKNNKGYYFKWRVHEDIALSMVERNAKKTLTNLTIIHTGYTNRKIWMKKNLRNYKLLLVDYKEEKHTLLYYGLVNSLLLLKGKKNLERAINLIDEMFETLKPKNDDPITPKMWMLRGAALVDLGQVLAAKQSLHKAFDEWRQPEAAVQLGSIYIDEKNYDRAIEVMETLHKKDGVYNVANTSIDPVQVDSILCQKLGDAYLAKANTDKSKRIECAKKAEEYYRQSLNVKPNNVLAADRLCQILRNTNRVNEASFITVNLVNKFPSYWVGWFNLGQDELFSNRPETAKLFFRRALELKKDYKEARHNLNMLLTMEKKNVHQP